MFNESMFEESSLSLSLVKSMNPIHDLDFGVDPQLCNQIYLFECFRYHMVFFFFFSMRESCIFSTFESQSFTTIAQRIVPDLNPPKYALISSCIIFGSG